MRSTTSALVLAVVCSLVSGQASIKEAELSTILKEVFGPGPSQPNTLSTASPLKPIPTQPPGVETCLNEANEAGECVPYYLCNNNSIITDGIGLIDIRLKDGPCTSYLDACCSPVNRVEEAITPAPHLPEAQIDEHPPCGLRNPDGVGFRITGDSDNEARYAEFPWMVAVLKESPLDSAEGTVKLNVYVCGGSLIHTKVTLTAAHCVVGNMQNKNVLIVRAGEWDTQTKKEIYPHQDRRVSDMEIHKSYYAGALFYDAALLFLETPVDAAANIGTVCLPPPGVTPTPGARCYASGWGKDKFGKEGQYQVFLKKIELPVVGKPECQDSLRKTRLGRNFNLHQSFMCAGGEPGKDTCRGDGGSPLVCPISGEERYEQTGIVAWGIGCGETGTPGVYVDVSMVRDWIDEHMNYKNLDKIETCLNEANEAGECVTYYLCKNNTIITDGIGIIDIRVRDGPCASYLDVCCTPVDRVEKPITPAPLLPKPQTPQHPPCGHRNLNGVGFRITGDSDNEAQFAEFPWMVAVLNESALDSAVGAAKLNSYLCGGSLIHPSVTLTAAHCVVGKVQNQLLVRAGEWDTQTDDEIYPHQDRRVSSMEVHQNYKPGALFYDAALLFLETPVNAADNIGTVCLPPPGVTATPGARCYASGWGKDQFGKEGQYQVFLKKIKLPVVGKPECQNALRKTRLGRRFYLHQSFICAGGEPGIDTCRGDGGSPLICPISGDERYEQAGIVAWGIGCGLAGTPGVYVDVSMVRDWIDENMTHKNLNNTTYTY